MNREFLDANPGDSTLAARVALLRTGRADADRAFPRSSIFDRETRGDEDSCTASTQPVTAGFGRNCLLARRLLERGVRFVQLFHGGAFGSPRINWDAHEDVVDNHTQAGRDPR